MNIAIFDKIKIFRTKCKEEATNLLAQAKDFIADTRYKIKNLYATNYQNGLTHLERGNLWDAVFRFKIITLIWPTKIEGQYNYAYCLVMRGKVPKAQAILSKIREQYPDANTLFQRLERGENTEIAREYLEKVGVGKEAIDQVIPETVPSK